MQQKCIHCDGLGHYYSHETFRTEVCPHCEGKGYIEINDIPVIETPVVEAPKPTKKTTKTTVETPVEPTIEAPIEPQADVDASKG